jgi:hypothetical protein
MYKFFEGFNGLPARTKIVCKINPKGKLPTQQYRYCRFIDDQFDFIMNFVQTDLNKEFLMECKSKNHSNILLLKKASNKFRLCVDYRLLNSIIRTTGNPWKM